MYKICHFINVKVAIVTVNFCEQEKDSKTPVPELTTYGAQTIDKQQVMNENSLPRKVIKEMEDTNLWLQEM